MFTYQASVEFIEEENIYEINFSDFPDLQGVSYCKEDVELEAQEILLGSFAEYIELRKPIPLAAPTKSDATFTVYLPIICCLKIALHNAILNSAIQRADLARRLNINAQQIERLLDIHYASKIDLLEQALYLLGVEASITMTQKLLDNS
ncbi:MULTISPECIES: hypothetical protein [Providencia]|uniref:hypothetical protein n=1 Tax=Providencia TaxID=586 RepID=UPI000F7B1148|nr:hypothetical protein [Providencia rettgeri]MBV2191410.1 hypothetical protein [Providencia rettgeri]UPS64441.1 hypothetical protein M0M83_07950 [Providencia rettgeri]HEC8325274.1 hypothetical protein [Providencia rettgeri]